MATPFEPQSFLKTLVALPGVYRMLDERGVTLYVGKARNLRQRVASYFRDHQSSAKTRSLISPIVLATMLERLSAHLEVLRDHPLTTRRYYKRVEY